MFKKPLILVDGSSYLFRAYHALPPLHNSQGMPTGAVYGVLNMLRKLLKEYEPSHIAVIFDSKSKNFRHILYPAYKANRALMPNELQVQIPKLFAAIRAWGIPLIIEEGVEADDVIATFVAQAKQQDISVLISTGDKDLAQLVDSKITLIDTMLNRILDPEGVKQKFGVFAHQIVDYLALVGDSVDNIPGVPKIGQKTAASLLAKYHSLANLLEHADEVPGKIGENLRLHREAVLLGQQLITVQLDVPLQESLDQLLLKSPDYVLLRNLLSELEFKTWLADLPAESLESAAIQKPAIKYESILNLNVFHSWQQVLAKSMFLHL